MADTIEQISLNFTLPQTGGASGTASVGGTIDVDYTTNTVSMTIAANSGNYTEQFSTYTLTSPSAGNYMITATGNNSGNDTLSFSYTGQGPSTISNVALALNGANYAANSEPVASAAGCFAQGTRIRVRRPQGVVDVAVEDLRIGDDVLTSGGTTRPIIWLGRRIVNCKTHPRPRDVMPVRIEAGAFGVGKPERDLVVSPGHAVCVNILGEVLIPAFALVNGATVRAETIDRITYWHVELDAHDVVLAEGLPAESYIETDNRLFFATEGVVSIDAAPDVPRDYHAAFCRPFHADGLLVDAVRSQLMTLALEDGWQLEPTDCDLHLVVDGQRVDPSRSGSVATFLVKGGATDLCIASRTSVPAETSSSADRRQLGVQIERISVLDGFGNVQTLSIEDDRLTTGFHAIEIRGNTMFRWTDGHAVIPNDMLEIATGDFFIRIDLVATPTVYAWMPPARRDDRRYRQVSSLIS